VTLRVRLFGALAEGAGGRDVELPVDPPVAAAAVVDALRTALPGLAGLVDRSQLAVNLEIADPAAVVADGDEVALLPPVAGGAGAAPNVLVGVRDGLRVDEAIAAVAHPAAGATALFLGTVRDHSEGSDTVDRLEYRAYDEMAMKVMRTIATEVGQRWPAVRGVALLHAVGDLPVGAPTIAVACSAPHRDEAFAACRYALEEVKARAPVWKRELSGDEARWVGAEDHAEGRG
jgi:molybdopterin synthase catalytic subunit/molybdopterin converting factor small subunit